MQFALYGVVIGSLVIAGCATTSDPETLGTLKNPVKVRMPLGERAYLDRLRCPDGAPPSYNRQGSGGPAADGHIVDFYEVICQGRGKVIIIMDMYHGNLENRPVPGFTIVPG